MTTQAFSKRLGVLTPEQFQAALSRFELGDFVKAEPVSQGLFGQNVFVTSTKGEYVLRGAPHYPWQFPKEQFGATLLHEKTQVPVAYPYLLDALADIFGWSYLLMPRKAGVSATDSCLTQTERLSVARALGQNLAAMHALTWPESGTYDLASNTIASFAEGFTAWFLADVRRLLCAAEKNGGTGREDSVWIVKMLREKESALAAEFEPCFVMNDYNPNNVVVQRRQGEWRVSGLFDLMEYYFGNGEADLMRLTAVYLAEGGTLGARLARAFITAYLEQRPASADFEERFELFMLRDRLIVWQYGTRPEVKWFSKGETFRHYAEPYLKSHSLLGPSQIP